MQVRVDICAKPYYYHNPINQLRASFYNAARSTHITEQELTG